MASFARFAGISAIQRICVNSQRLQFKSSNVDAKCIVLYNSCKNIFCNRQYTVQTQAAVKTQDVGQIGPLPVQWFSKPLSAIRGRTEFAAPATSLERQLFLLDDQVRRWGRVDKEQVLHLIKLLEKEGKISAQQAVMSLKCTGALMVKETQANRVALFDTMWKRIEATGLAPSIQLYNAVMRVKLENDQRFSPSEVLADIETAKQLVPNRLTYQLLLSEFCEIGDVAGASMIVEHMKKNGLSLNEAIFNAFVKGHLRKGDIAGSKEVITNMKKAGLEPTSDTYKVLIVGYAETGNLDAIKQTLMEAAKDEVTILPQALCDVYYTMVTKGHLKDADEILGMIRQKKDMKHNQDLYNLMFQLNALGHDDAAYQAFLAVDRSGYDDMTALTSGRILFRAMLLQGRPLEKVLETWRKLRAQNLVPEDIEELSVAAIKYQTPEYSMKVLEHMVSEGYPIRAPLFWPALSIALSTKEYDKVMHILAQFAKCRDVDMTGTLLGCAKRMIGNGGHDLESILAMFGKAGLNLSEQSIEFLRTSLLISAGKFTEAAKHISDGANVTTGILKVEIPVGYESSRRDANGLVMLLSTIGRLDANSEVLLQLLNDPGIDNRTLNTLLSAWADKGLKLAKKFEVDIKQKLASRSADPEIIKKFEGLFESAGMNERFTKILNSSVGELEEMLEKSKTANNKAIMKTLLVKYCREREVEKAEKLKATMDAQGFVFGADTLRELGTMFARDKRSLSDALSCKEQIESQYPVFDQYATLVLHIAELQMKAGNMEDVLATLRGYVKLHPDAMQNYGFADSARLCELCTRLLTAHQQQHTAQQLLTLAGCVFECGYVKMGTYDVLDELMKACLQKGDSESMVLAMEYCMTKHTRSPQFSAVFRQLIMKEDADNLQKVVDLVTTLHGEMDVLLSLVVCFVECGKVKQARKILETPGLNVTMEPLMTACSILVSQNKEKELEQLVSVTKGVQGVDREEMLFQLIRLHARNKSDKKMMEVYNLFEEEYISPRPRTLRYMAKFLKDLGVPVPFDVPVVQERLLTPNMPRSGFGRSVQDSTQKPAFARSTARSAGMDSAKVQSDSTVAAETAVEMAGKAKRLVATGNEQEAIDYVVGTSQQLLQKGDGRKLDQLLHQLADNGYVSLLKPLFSLQLEHGKRNFLHQCVFRAYLNGDKFDDLMRSVEGDTAALLNYITTGNLEQLAKKRPDRIDEVLQLVEDSVDPEKHLTHIVFLHDYYMLNNNYDRAKQLLQKYPQMKNKNRLSFLCQKAKERNNEDVLRAVIKLHLDPTMPRSVINPYNQLLQMKCEQGQWEGASEVYNSAMKSGLRTIDFWARSLQQLASLLEANKQPMPWQPGTLEKLSTRRATRPQRVAESSDSSGSESDDNVVEKPTRNV